MRLFSLTYSYICLGQIRKSVDKKNGSNHLTSYNMLCHLLENAKIILL